MPVSLRAILLTCFCFFILACKKQEATNGPLPRLHKVIANGVDSMRNHCNSCLFTQLYSYDEKGRLVTILDSAGYWNHQYHGPQPYGVGYPSRLRLEYDGQGRLLKAARDSFAYNSQGQLIVRYRRISSDTSSFFVTNRFTYDSGGRLVADSGYIKQSFSNPNGILYGYDLFAYDARDNMIQNDRFELWPPGSVRHETLFAQYDNHTSPYKALGLLPYLVFYSQGILLSPHNCIKAGYNYEYNTYGQLKKITYGYFYLEFFYE